MLEAGLKPTSVTLASVLPACDPDGGGVCAGKQIHCFAVRHSLDTNVFVGTALVDMYSKCAEISTAEHVFDGMTDKSTVSYTTMISGLGQHGFGQRALSLFYSMEEKGLKPDAVIFLAVISACNYSGLVKEGLAYLGVPVSYKQVSAAAFAGMVSKLHKRLDPWKKKFLSTGARQLLNNSSLSSLPMYTMGVYYLQLRVTGVLLIS